MLKNIFKKIIILFIIIFSLNANAQSGAVDPVVMTHDSYANVITDTSIKIQVMVDFIPDDTSVAVKAIASEDGFVTSTVSPTHNTFSSTETFSLEVIGLNSGTEYTIKVIGSYGTVYKTYLDNIKLKTTGQKAIPVNPDGTIQTNTDCPPGVYCYLAPLGEKAYVDTNNYNIGDYLKWIFMFGIGAAGLLSVVMLILAGLQYMGGDSFFNKEEAKHKMTRIITGLVIALGSVVLLNTLNPELIKIKLNLGKETIEEDIVESNDTPPAKGPVAKCPEGIVTVTTTGGPFPVCKKVSTDLKNMIDMAWAQGYKIYGYGFRSREKQIKLRIDNCGGDTEYNKFSKPPGQCKPPTAIPGTSNHESGLAFDLKCEGQTIRSHDNKCFVWLKANAETYNFKNLASEPWHWSVDGK